MEGRVALVTGAGSGLGAATAHRLAADGALVVVNDLDADAAARVASEVGGESSPFDVADSAAFDAAVDAVVDRHGQLDVLVSNAGFAADRPDVYQRGMASTMARLAGSDPEPLESLTSLSDREWDRMIRVHLYGTFHGARAALRHMTPARRGSIVNMASILGITGSAASPDYAAAKGAIIAFTKSVAAEVAPLGIRVNAVAPGFIDTPLLSMLDEGMRAMIAMRTGAGRLGTAAEVAEAVRFLAGDESSYCYGEVMTVTGAFGL